MAIMFFLGSCESQVRGTEQNSLEALRLCWLLGAELAEGGFAHYTRAAWNKRVFARWRMPNGGDHESTN